jgi:predicted RNA binding protein YcfA (HicA-like mRNA interferase family)
MPSATARELQRVARLLEFVLIRTTGNQERWNHPDGRAVTIPWHGGREIGPPLFFKILASWEFLWPSLISYAELGPRKLLGLECGKRCDDRTT